MAHQACEPCVSEKQMNGGGPTATKGNAALVLAAGISVVSVLLLAWFTWSGNLIAVADAISGGGVSGGFLFVLASVVCVQPWCWGW